MTSHTQTPVLVIGGGIVGLAFSLLLHHHSIPCILVERHSSTSIHPRSRSVNARTMEVFRHLGIDSLVREAGKDMSPTFGIHSGTSLREVIEKKKRSEGERKMPIGGLLDGVSPGTGLFVTQDLAEPVLLKAAKERGVDVKFYTECLGVEQDDNSSTATLKDRQTGTTSTIHADYLIAADGAKSPIRTHLNVPTSGQGTMGYLLNIFFIANLRPLVHNREFSICLVSRPEVNGAFASINNSDRWVFHLSYDPEKGEKAEDFTPEKCTELLHVALGIPDIEINVKSILPWEPTVHIAERFKVGRVFLAGDAAHQMPPWAGQGANSGVGDAYNLAWKIAAVLKGHAPPALLETYDPERLPVARVAADASAAGADEKGMISTKFNLALVRSVLKKAPLISGHGYGYSSKAICDEYTGPLGGLTWRPWTLSSLFFAIDGRPGRRMPHVWVERKGERISTLDLCGKRFVVLAGADGKAWVEAAKEVSSKMRVEIEAYCVDVKGELVDKRGEFEAAAGITSRGALLVRPDDFVAYRERRQRSDHKAALEKAMRQALCL